MKREDKEKKRRERERLITKCEEKIEEGSGEEGRLVR